MNIAAQLQNLDRALLAKAFRGELVPQDPNDEPADAMLARLRGESPSPPPDPSAKRRRGRRPRTEHEEVA
jgi:type I restriction enzyme S subunit